MYSTISKQLQIDLESEKDGCTIGIYLENRIAVARKSFKIMFFKRCFFWLIKSRTCKIGKPLQHLKLRVRPGPDAHISVEIPVCPSFSTNYLCYILGETGKALLSCRAQVLETHDSAWCTK